MPKERIRKNPFGGKKEVKKQRMVAIDPATGGYIFRFNSNSEPYNSESMVVTSQSRAMNVLRDYFRNG
jgi:hypothetical protein